MFAHLISASWLIVFMTAGSAAPVTTLKTAGACSPAVADVKGNVTITCSGVTTEAQKKLEKVPALLEQIIRNQDRSDIMARLDLIIGAVEPAPTDSFLIYGIHVTQAGLQVSTTSFPYSDMKKTASYSEFRDLLAKIPDGYSSEEAVVIFRSRDERLIEANGADATSAGNMSVIIVPKELMKEFNGDNHFAFTYLKSKVDTMVRCGQLR